MSMHDRAAQFSPFAALTGFDGVIAETGRRTDQKIELSESQMTLLNQKLNLIDDAVQDGYHPMVTVVYFVPDAKKDGGSYQEYTGKMRQLDPVERKLVFLAANERSAGKEISIDDILEIHGTWWIIWMTYDSRAHRRHLFFTVQFSGDRLFIVYE